MPNSKISRDGVQVLRIDPVSLSQAGTFSEATLRRWRSYASNAASSLAASRRVNSSAQPNKEYQASARLRASDDPSGRCPTRSPGL